MSEEFNASADCSGDCSSCGSDCGGNVDLSQPTVTLTLDDDTDVTCAVINIFPAGDRQYIALLPLDENGENQSGEVYLYRFYEDEQQQPQSVTILKRTRNTRRPPMPSTSWHSRGELDEEG